MRLIDVHSHLEWPDFKGKLGGVKERANANNVIAAISSSVMAKSAQEVLDIQKEFKGFIFACCGFAPAEFKKHPQSVEDFIKFSKDHADEFLALGEIGLDYYWIKDKDTRDLAERRFIELLNLADTLNKPIVIHCRDAEEKTIQLIEENFQGDKVHMHCFSGPPDLIKRGLKNGWMFSVPTSVVSRKYHQRLADTVPIDRMMLETDSPFLSPLRGEKRNEPKNIAISAKFIANMKKVNLEEFAESTTQNAIDFYSLKNKIRID
ncbi:MAG: hypothetical protein GF364_20550 [Candidatus Lokiarchaeota archaeon]|nr:hypothetical protein [Candidatus Lokiarchaeota archaeon]